MTAEIIVSAVIGLSTGILGTFFAPWVNWGIEKRKLKLEAKRQLIYNARLLINKPSCNIFQFRRSDIYTQLQDIFSESINILICMDEDDYIYESQHSYTDVDQEHKYQINLDLNRIAKKWGLE